MSDDVLFLTPRPYIMVLARVCLLFPNFCLADLAQAYFNHLEVVNNSDR